MDSSKYKHAQIYLSLAQNTSKFLFLSSSPLSCIPSVHPLCVCLSLLADGCSCVRYFWWFSQRFWLRVSADALTHKTGDFEAGGIRQEKGYKLRGKTCAFKFFCASVFVCTYMQKYDCKQVVAEAKNRAVIQPVTHQLLRLLQYTAFPINMDNYAFLKKQRKTFS